MARKRRRTTRRRRKAPKKSGLLNNAVRRQISGMVQSCAGALLLLGLRGDAGPVGDYLTTFLSVLFGKWSVLFPITLLVSGGITWFSKPKKRTSKKKEAEHLTRQLAGLAICLASFLGAMHIGAPLEEVGVNMRELAGGIGFVMSMPFLLFASRAVGYTVLSSLFLVGIFIAFEPNLLKISSLVLSIFSVKSKKKKRIRRVQAEEELEEEEEFEEVEEEDLVELDQEAPELNIVRPAFAQKVVKDASAKKISHAVKQQVDSITMQDTRYEEWTFPDYELLESAKSALTVNDELLKQQARLIEEKLDEFGIKVTVCDAHPGPTVTQFTLRPAEGVKLSKIANLKNDLALALAAPSLRIEAPIPGKSLVGIEMPNIDRTIVYLREILESPEFVHSNSSLTLPLGRDVSGRAMVSALEDMPHLLIAGATGSGKSVCMNTFLTALLYQNAPDQLKFILIDPKRVELMPYDGIPHLLTPVITESEKALQALRWAVAEMGRRLHRLSEAGTRNIQEYNDKQNDDEHLLPRIVIVVDELADLMMRQFRRDTEMMVARIAQMARAVGIHLIIATQRPSVDVITGLIKANIPTRLAFRTVSSVDSRTVLDCIGAEDLLGRGDMLLLSAEIANPQRIQGIFISTKEVERVINAVKIAGGGKITEEISIGEEPEENRIVDATSTNINLDADDNGGDDRFFEALQVVQASGKASASLLQRQLKVGYARAARLLDTMEERGLIGPADGAKARKVYRDSMAN